MKKYQFTQKEGIAITRYIRANGITQTEVARTLGISAANLNRVIKGCVRYNEKDAFRLYEALGKPAELSFLLSPSLNSPENLKLDKAWQTLFTAYMNELGEVMAHRPLNNKTEVLGILEKTIGKYKS